MTPADYRRLLTPLLAEQAHALRTCQEEEERLHEAQAQERAARQAQELVQSVAEQIQNQVHAQLASIVSRCLTTVFGDDAYGFRINFVKRRGKTEAELLFVRNGQDIDPLRAAGGGAVDVAAFALRLACLLLLRPKKRRLLVLDEPFRFVSREYRPRVRVLLEELARELEVQFLMVTHSKELVCGKVIQIGGEET